MPQQQNISARMKEFGLSENNYWKSTLQSVDAALSMLSAFDGRHIREIDIAIDSLCKLLAIGDDFDKAKERPQEPRQETNNRTVKPYDTINEIDAFEAQFTRCLQKAIELFIKDYYINQHNSEMKTSDAGKPQNRHTSGDWDFNDAECDYNERQFAKDMKMAIELSLEDKVKKNKAHGTEAHDGAGTPVQRDGFSVTNEQRNNGEITSNATLEQEGLVKISTYGVSHSNWSSFDPLFESNEPLSYPRLATLKSYTANGDKVDNIVNKPQPEPSESLRADLVFPTVSVPIPVRHNVSTALHAQEQTMINITQPQYNATQISNIQNQLSYQPLQHYRQQAKQQQKRQRRYQQQHLPQAVKFTPRETGSLSSSENSTPVIVKNAATGFEGKPCKTKVFDDLLNRGVLASPRGILGWVNNSSGAASWELFASSTDTKWKRGIDIEIADWEKEQAKNETETLPQGKSVTNNKHTFCLIDSNTCICDDCISVETDGTEDNWTKEEERPDTMVIFIPRNPIRKSKGPRIFRPDDGDFESDDEEQEEETDG
ncbi:uncharacterized protein ATC70_003320 [Mucor velutinosus]|uniref:Uncharacterized protein n=1 Tax=Mucor velutinosus TaxID=708070 RepID=A0AAN7HYU9_9FUNG|nr:hypothetical protein ATC70_003320 [Mucor velutinosus]